MPAPDRDERDPTGSDRPAPKPGEHLGLPDPPPQDDAKALPNDDRLDTETSHAPDPEA